MRNILAAFALLIAASALDGAKADPYRWCAYYTGEMSGSNCWFMTLEQCRATISGVGGTCSPNPFYDGRPIGSERAAPRPRR